MNEFILEKVLVLWIVVRECVDLQGKRVLSMAKTTTHMSKLHRLRVNMSCLGFF